MELSRKDFCSIFLFKFKLGDTAAHTTVDLCEAFGPFCVSVKTVERWFKKFRSGDFNLEDAHRAGRPNEIDQELINSELEDNPAFSNVMLAEKLGFSDHAIRNQLHAMGRVYKLGKWISHVLAFPQKKLRMTMCFSLFQHHLQCNFLNCIVTSDEK